MTSYHYNGTIDMPKKTTKKAKAGKSTSSPKSAKQKGSPKVKNIKQPELAGELGYTIDPEFEGLFSKKTPKQYAELKASIRKEGLRDPLVVWKERNILLDGHHRDEICKELGIDPSSIPVHRLSFADKDSAKMWVLQNQFIRRNMNPFLRVESALQFEDFFAAQARDNKHGGVRLNSTEGGGVNKKIATLAKVSPDTVKKVKKILAKKDVPEVAEAINALRNDDPDFSIHSVFQTHCHPANAEPNATSNTKGKPPQGIAARIDRVISTLNDIDKKCTQAEDRTNFYTKIIDWATAKRDGL